MGLDFDPIHEHLTARWSTDEGSFDQRIDLTTAAPYFGGKRR